MSTTVELDGWGHAYAGDLTDHNDPDHTGSPDGLCIDCAEMDGRP